MLCRKCFVPHIFYLACRLCCQWYWISIEGWFLRNSKHRIFVKTCSCIIHAAEKINKWNLPGFFIPTLFQFSNQNVKIIIQSDIEITSHWLRTWWRLQTFLIFLHKQSYCEMYIYIIKCIFHIIMESDFEAQYTLNKMD